MADRKTPDSTDENQDVAVAFTDDDDETGLLPAHPAATVIVFHESQDASPPHLLMVRRATTMTFAAGAAVFPGGRVDADDEMIAAGIDGTEAGSVADRAARVAAIRETLEETGLLIGSRPVEHARVRDMRAALAEGQAFSGILAHHGVTLRLDDLVPFARWRPNFAHARIFDTRFFLTRLDGPRPRLDVDNGENSELFWLPAQSVLDNADAGGIHVIFPTRRNLERLAQFDSYAAAVASAQQFPPRRITPWLADRDGRRWLCIRDDCGYPVTSEIMDSAMRG